MIASINAWMAIITATVYVIGMIVFFKPSAKITIFQALILASIVGCIIATREAMRQQTGEPSLALSVVVWGLFALSHLFFWTAIAAHGKRRPNVAFCIEQPAYFVRSGPYRWVRHPFYVSYILAWIGIALLAGSPIVWALVAWLVVIYAIAARREETLFRQTMYSQEHEDYVRNTGFFIPQLIPRTASGIDAAASNSVKADQHAG